jgi:hypothetical protein
MSGGFTLRGRAALRSQKVSVEQGFGVAHLRTKSRRLSISSGFRVFGLVVFTADKKRRIRVEQTQLGGLGVHRPFEAAGNRNSISDNRWVSR